MHSRYTWIRWGGGGGGGNKRKRTKTSFSTDTVGRGSFSSQRRGIRYFAFLLKLNDRRFAGFLAFIRPVVQWITRQGSFAPILSPWNARFSLLLVLGKYSYALGQQPSWRVPPYFRQFSLASPLRMRENLSERVYTPTRTHTYYNPPDISVFHTDTRARAHTRAHLQLVKEREREGGREREREQISLKDCINSKI